MEVMERRDNTSSTGLEVITAVTWAEPNILKNSWRLRSDQDGGSGGHLLGQGWVQVREKATGDLLVFVFVKIPLKLSLFCESKSFFTTFCVVLS